LQLLPAHQSTSPSRRRRTEFFLMLLKCQLVIYSSTHCQLSRAAERARALHAHIFAIKRSSSQQLPCVRPSAHRLHTLAAAGSKLTQVNATDMPTSPSPPHTSSSLPHRREHIESFKGTKNMLKSTSPHAQHLPADSPRRQTQALWLCTSDNQCACRRFRGDQAVGEAVEWRVTIDDHCQLIKRH
jgi:hypothetical protein